MPNSDAFYAEDDVRDLLKENCKERGDKSKIINQAVRKYFLPETRIKLEPTELKRVIVEI